MSDTQEAAEAEEGVVRPGESASEGAETGEERPSGKQEKPSADAAAAERSAEKAADGAKMSFAARAKQWARSKVSWRGAVAGAAAVALCGVIGFGFVQYREAKDELARIHQTEADRNAAAALAKEYALKSLTYTYRDPDGFFASVEDGVAPTLKDKYANVADLLKGIMVQAKVESSGEVLAADVTPQPGGVYQVVVAASQTTKNLQNPQPRVSSIVLQVVVAKIGSTWQVSDIGPKAGMKLPPGAQPPQDGHMPQPPGSVPGAEPEKPNAAPLFPGTH